jgi:hypothetical protein
MTNTTNEGQEAYKRENPRPTDEVFAGCLSILLIVSRLLINVYGPEHVVFFRETAVGQSVLSYWAAHR